MCRQDPTEPPARPGNPKAPSREEGCRGSCGRGETAGLHCAAVNRKGFHRGETPSAHGQQARPPSWPPCRDSTGSTRHKLQGH